MEGEGEIGNLPMNGNIFNSQGVHVATVVGSSIYGLRGQKLYDLNGTKIYKQSGELVGHLANARASEKHLDRATDKLFPNS
jgi:coproporphyrinogen III oxidase